MRSWALAVQDAAVTEMAYVDESGVTDRSKAAGWVKLAVAKGYSIQPDGTPIGVKGHPLKGSLHKTGRSRSPYRSINVKVGRDTKRVFVHQLQAYQMFGEAALAEGVQVRHLNGDSVDNRDTNIAIGSQLDNHMDRPAEVRQLHAQKAANARKLWTDAKVRELRQAYANGSSLKTLAEVEGVAKSTLSMMLNKVTYKSVKT